jgi:hypothetical protein
MRIREAMDGAADNGGPLGGEGKIVEADETRFGTKKPEEWRFSNELGWFKYKRRDAGGTRRSRSLRQSRELDQRELARRVGC